MSEPTAPGPVVSVAPTEINWQFDVVDLGGGRMGVQVRIVTGILVMAQLTAEGAEQVASMLMAKAQESRNVTGLYLPPGTRLNGQRG
jgi:hypothetical protein